VTEKRVVETRLRVRYAETDAMGVVYHANYLIWFEAGRGDYFRTLDQDYNQWEQRGYWLPVSEAYARYYAPARFGDLVAVLTHVEEIRSRGLTLGYEVVDASSRRRLVTGWTKHICMDREGRAQRLPAEMRTMVELT
jgi:acyl-CoA thioester hydrolase